MPPTAATSQPLSPGVIVGGKYRVERVLGAGGMAVVVEATHVALGRRVAIKILQGDGARAAEVSSRFHREAQIAAQLPGEHIARVSDVGVTDAGEPYLVMELLVGRDLDAELRARGQLPVAEAVDYVLQACEGVAEAHGAGLVHRDLKPGNLFLTRRRDGTPVIKVLDFGISKADPGRGDQSLTKTTSTFGTPLYMSPEQVQSAKHVDGRSDQHALGAILYALLAGKPPYQGETLTALAVVIATQPPQPLCEQRADIPEMLEAAVLRALAKIPAQRFRDLAAFAEAIAPFGSADAPARVAAVASALAPEGRDAAGDPISRVVQLSPAYAPPASSEAVGSAEDHAERRRFLLLTAITTLVTVAIGLIALVFFTGHRESGSGLAVSASAEAVGADASASAAQSAPVPPDVAPSEIAAPASDPSSSTAALPSASSAAPANPRASAAAATKPAHPALPQGKPPSKKKPPTSATSDPTDVFSTRR